MRKSKFTEARIISALKENEGGRTAAEVPRELGVAVATFYGWRKRYAGMEASEVRRLKEQEAENAKLYDRMGQGPRSGVVRGHGARHPDAQRRVVKKVVGPRARRRAAGYLRDGHAISTHRACRVARSVRFRPPRASR